MRRTRPEVRYKTFVAADTAGAIGWSLMGRVPVRAELRLDAPHIMAQIRVLAGSAGASPTNIRASSIQQQGVCGRQTRARSMRKLGSNFLGDGGHDLGARAAQIRDSLFALPVAPPLRIWQRSRRTIARCFSCAGATCYSISLNDAAVANAPARAQARELIEKWSARARADDVGYRIVRAFRLRVRKDVFDSFTVAGAH